MNCELSAREFKELRELIAILTDAAHLGIIGVDEEKDLLRRAKQIDAWLNQS